MQDKYSIETRASLDTPEGVQLSFQLAGPGLRMSAYIADVVIRIAAIFFLGLLLVMALGTLGFGELSAATIMILLFLAEWGYGTLFEWLWNGRTPGKRMFGIRAVKEGGYPIGFYEAVLRNFLRGADAPFVIFYGIGLLVMMSTKRLQRLGDLFAGTMVVVEQGNRVPHRPRNLQMVPAIERSDCKRSFHVSERTLDVICRLFERTGYLSGPRREAIATVLAEPIADRLGFELLDLPPDSRGSRFLIRVIKTFSRSAEEQEQEVHDFAASIADDREPVLSTGAPE
ncbi:MAG: RDD family protein [Planctomycetaceae bacterium]